MNFHLALKLFLRFLPKMDTNCEINHWHVSMVIVNLNLGVVGSATYSASKFALQVGDLPIPNLHLHCIQPLGPIF